MTTSLKSGIVALTLCAAGLAAGDEESTGRACSNATLKGAYAVAISGTRPAPRILPEFPGMPVGATEQVIGVFLLIFDGQGTQRSDSLAIKGSLSGLFPVEGGSGPYTVKADCTGSFSGNTPGVPFPLVNQLVIFNRGKEFRTIVSAPQGVMVTATAKKVGR